MAAPSLLRQRVVAALSHGSLFADLLPVLSPPLARADPEVLASIPTSFDHGFWPPSVPNFGCTSYTSMLPPSSTKTGFTFLSLRSELLIASGATTAGMYLWSKAGKEAGDNDLIKVNDGDMQKPSSNPPQQGGNGSGGLGDEDKWVFVKLLTDLQKQVNRLLEGKEYAQELRSDLERKKVMLEIGADELRETRVLVEKLIKEMEDRNGLNHLIVLMQEFATDLKSLEAKLDRHAVKKHPILVFLESLFPQEVASRLFVGGSIVGSTISFCQGKIMFAVGFCACVSCKVLPDEFFRICVLVLKDTIEEKRVKITKLQDRLVGTAGPEEPPVDVGGIVKAINELMEDLRSDTKIFLVRKGVKQQVVSGESGGEQVVSGESGGVQVVSGESGGEQVVSGESGGGHVVSGESGGEHVVSGESGGEHVVSGESGGEQFGSGEAGGQ